MLRSGLTPDSILPCTPTITVDGREFQNVPGYPESSLGDIPLSEAIAHSCNTAMISQAGIVSQEALHDAAADLGLGVVAPGLGVPAAYGSVPETADGTAHAAALIGQGEVVASPLAMATLAASVAAGHRVEPVLVRPAAQDTAQGAAQDPVQDASEATPTDAAAEAPDTAGEAQVAPPNDLTPDEAAALHDLMRGVVTDGSGRALADLPGDLAAKTGTAEHGEGSGVHAWMIAIQDDLAVAVMVEDGESGSGTAGPLLHDFLEAAAQG
ncbi:hypothetical protein GCM10025865_10110 [Paraoerskovia sediminicola]|uniref:Penicillin-binding protein transpeptidase domain-containing protein n=2 Tax=Paraoerskovia sediminicola TaxID=1138587 RepID=A0ABM8G160_9CELL|nr:hypothetical protein GCM10025865_10110 [Paraoerskovia sediminicola]